MIKQLRNSSYKHFEFISRGPLQGKQQIYLDEILVNTICRYMFEAITLVIFRNLQKFYEMLENVLVSFVSLLLKLWKSSESGRNRQRMLL